MMRFPTVEKIIFYAGVESLTNLPTSTAHHGKQFPCYCRKKRLFSVLPCNPQRCTKSQTSPKREMILCCGWYHMEARGQLINWCNLCGQLDLIHSAHIWSDKKLNSHLKYTVIFSTCDQSHCPCLSSWWEIWVISIPEEGMWYECVGSTRGRFYTS